MRARNSRTVQFWVENRHCEGAVGDCGNLLPLALIQHSISLAEPKSRLAFDSEPKIINIEDPPVIGRNQLLFPHPLLRSHTTTRPTPKIILATRLLSKQLSQHPHLYHKTQKKNPNFSFIFLAIPLRIGSEKEVELWDHIGLPAS